MALPPGPAIIVLGGAVDSLIEYCIVPWRFTERVETIGQKQKRLEFYNNLKHTLFC